MRKIRRHKYLQISVFFLIYSIIHVVSVSNNDGDKKQDNTKVGNDKIATVNSTADKPANATSDAHKTTTEHHKHIAEKMGQHLLGAFGDHGSANASMEHPGNGSLTHRTRHGSELSDKEKIRHHVGESTIHHLSGSLGNHSLNHTEHLGEGFLHHLGGALGSNPSNATGQANVTKNGTKHVLAGATTTGNGKANHTKGNGTEESKAEVECTPPAIKQVSSQFSITLMELLHDSCRGTRR